MTAIQREVLIGTHGRRLGLTATGELLIESATIVSPDGGPISFPDGIATGPSLPAFSASGSALATTGSMGSRSGLLYLDDPLDFEDGHGVCIFNVGAMPTVQPPTGASATPVGLTGSTTYVYSIAPLDEAGGVGAAIATFKTTTGNAVLSQTQYVNYNALSWTRPTSGPVPVAYAIYGDGGLGRALSLIGVTTATTFNDIGDAGWSRVAPYWVPLSPPSAPLAQALITKVMGGGGTPSLTLRDACINGGVSVFVIHDDTEAFAAALNAGMVQNKPVAIPTGTYIVSNQTFVTMTGDVEVNAERNAILKSGPMLGLPIVQFEDVTSRDRYGLTWRGGTFDNSWGLFTGAANSNSCLGATRLIRLLVEGVTFLGADTYTRAGISDDSGIQFSDCKDVSIIGNFFRGMGDLGIYNGGGSLVGAFDDGGEHSIVGNHFDNCFGACGWKREAPCLIFANNTVRNCYSGISALEAGPGVGRQMLVIGNTFRKIETSAARFDNSVYGQFVGNKIIDFGYMPDGVTPSLIPFAIRNLGSSNLRISGNTIALDEWAQLGVISPVGFAQRGLGYSANDTVTVEGGAVITVDSVDGSGRIITAHVSTPGVYTAALSNPVPQASTSGSGTGVQFNLTFGGNGSASHQAIAISGYPIAGITYLPNRTTISDNDFININSAIVESITHGTPGPTAALDNTYTNVTHQMTPVNPLSFNMFSDLNLGVYRHFYGTAEVTRLSNGSLLTERLRTFKHSIGFTDINNLGVTLAFGTVPANSSTDLLVSFSVATAEAVATPGSGYAPGDTIPLAGGTSTSAAVITVGTVDSNGSILTASISTPGSYSVVPSNPVSQASTSGSGTGASFNMTFGGGTSGILAGSYFAECTAVASSGWPAGIEFSCRCDTDSITVRAANNTTGDIAIPSGSYSLSIRQLG